MSHVFDHPFFLTLKSPDILDGPFLIEWLMYTRTHKWKYRSAYDMGICSICPFEFVLFNNNIVRWDYILHFKPLLYQVVRVPLPVSAQNRISLGFFWFLGFFRRSAPVLYIPGTYFLEYPWMTHHITAKNDSSDSLF